MRVNILQVTESHAKADGGVTTVVNDLTHHIGELGVYSCVLAATDIEEPVPINVDFIKMGLRCNAMSALFSTEIKEDVRQIIIDKQINVIHIHGIWMPLHVIASRVAKEMNIPFIVTAHGMLEPWLWTGKGWKGWLKKKIYFSTVVYPAYKYADRIHAITPQESEGLNQLFSSNKIICVPNAIDLTKQGDAILASHEKIIFFIGRITPIKGVSLLIEAFSNADLPSDWMLVIAGPEEVPEYMIELRELVREKKLASRVQFIGSVYAEEKESWYQRAWVTVVPSYSEVISMVNLESAMLQCPSITTTTTGLWDWEEGGGLLINPDVVELTSALRKVVEWNDDERFQRGKKSYELVSEKYSWDVVGKQWVNLYAELAKNGANT